MLEGGQLYLYRAPTGHWVMGTPIGATHGMHESLDVADTPVDAVWEDGLRVTPMPSMTGNFILTSSGEASQPPLWKPEPMSTHLWSLAEMSRLFSLGPGVFRLMSFD